MPFADTELASDADLTAWEHTLPALALKQGAYAGKRTLAKNYIEKQLLKRSIDPATLQDPSQLKDAATFKELELMFADLAGTKEDVAYQKSLRYRELFESELELILLKLTSGRTVSASFSSIPLRRA